MKRSTKSSTDSYAYDNDVSWWHLELLEILVSEEDYREFVLLLEQPFPEWSDIVTFQIFYDR